MKIARLFSRKGWRCLGGIRGFKERIVKQCKSQDRPFVAVVARTSFSKSAFPISTLSGVRNPRSARASREMPVRLGPVTGKPCDYGTVKIFPEYGSLTLLPEG